MMGLGFQVGVGSVIENTQIVFITESFNDFTLVSTKGTQIKLNTKTTHTQ